MQSKSHERFAGRSMTIHAYIAYLDNKAKSKNGVENFRQNFVDDGMTHSRKSRNNESREPQTTIIIVTITLPIHQKKIK